MCALRPEKWHDTPLLRALVDGDGHAETETAEQLGLDMAKPAVRVAIDLAREALLAAEDLSRADKPALRDRVNNALGCLAGKQTKSGRREQVLLLLVSYAASYKQLVEPEHEASRDDVHPHIALLTRLWVERVGDRARVANLMAASLVASASAATGISVPLVNGNADAEQKFCLETAAPKLQGIGGGLAEGTPYIWQPMPHVYDLAPEPGAVWLSEAVLKAREALECWYRRPQDLEPARVFLDVFHLGRGDDESLKRAWRTAKNAASRMPPGI
jgi:hypothetical protein